jgi:hypothetical protein
MLALLNGCFLSPVDKVVSYCPNALAHNDDYFHKEGDIQPVRFAGLLWLKVLFAGLL